MLFYALFFHWNHLHHSGPTGPSSPLYSFQDTSVDPELKVKCFHASVCQRQAGITVVVCADTHFSLSS